MVWGIQPTIVAERSRMARKQIDRSVLGSFPKRTTWGSGALYCLPRNPNRMVPLSFSMGPYRGFSISFRVSSRTRFRNNTSEIGGVDIVLPSGKWWPIWLMAQAYGHPNADYGCPPVQTIL